MEGAEIDKDLGEALGKEDLFFFPFSSLAAPHGMWDLSSPTRDQTCAPYIGRHPRDSVAGLLHPAVEVPQHASLRRHATTIAKLRALSYLQTPNLPTAVSQHL